MKILLLNYTDAGGGAANGALLLTEALNEYGIDAKLGVVEKKTASRYVIQCELLKKSKLKSFFTRISAKPGAVTKKLTSVLLIEVFVSGFMIFLETLKSFISNFA